MQFLVQPQLVEFFVSLRNEGFDSRRAKPAALLRGDCHRCIALVCRDIGR
jgi:hypothetical protein